MQETYSFAGLMPSKSKTFPDKWFNDNEEGNKNEFELLCFEVR
jgi:hypothetical protein